MALTNDTEGDAIAPGDGTATLSEGTTVVAGLSAPLNSRDHRVLDRIKRLSLLNSTANRLEVAAGTHPLFEELGPKLRETYSSQISTERSHAFNKLMEAAKTDPAVSEAVSEAIVTKAGLSFYQKDFVLAASADDQHQRRALVKLLSANRQEVVLSAAIKLHAGVTEYPDVVDAVLAEFPEDSAAASGLCENAKAVTRLYGLCLVIAGINRPDVDEAIERIRGIKNPTISRCAEIHDQRRAAAA